MGLLFVCLFFRLRCFFAHLAKALNTKGLIGWESAVQSIGQGLFSLVEKRRGGVWECGGERWEGGLGWAEGGFRAFPCWDFRGRRMGGR